MKNILVISDNPQLTSFFQEECIRQNVLNTADVQYKYSVVNKNPAGMIALGATPIDVKSLQSVDDIKCEFDIVFSLHCKQIFPEKLVESVTCVNVHPGLNPHNRGWYPQVFSIVNGKPIGATIHLMDKEVDHGRIIDQIEVIIHSDDTSLDVYERVIGAEKQLIIKNLLEIVDGTYSTIQAAGEGNYNSIGDFKSLCNLNLDSTATLRVHIDLLRSLTHGNFKNAYFFNENGKRVFISVNLEEE